MDIQNNNAICPVPFYSVSYNTTGVMGPCTHCDLTEFKPINEYWDSVWLQESSNPDDRWKSDWIRAIISAYAVDGSIPSNCFARPEKSFQIRS